MNVNDYTQRLADSRNRYNDSLNEMRDNYKKNSEKQEELHAKREKLQHDNYVQQKRDMEVQSAANMDRYDKDIKKELDIRQERYRKGLEGQKRTFNEDRRKLMDNYNYKLDSISRSFDTAATEKEKLHAMYKDSLEERFTKGLGKREKHFNSKLEGIQKNSIDAINEFRDVQTKEKRDMLNRFGNEKKQLVQDANIAKNKANNIHQEEIERLRENQKNEMISLANNKDNQSANMLKNKNNERDVMLENFEEMTSNINERNKKAMDSIGRQNKSEKRQLEKNFAKDRLTLERKVNKLVNEGSTDKINDTRKRLEKAQEARVQNLVNSIDENNYKNQLLNERIASDNSDTLKRMEISHNKDLEKKDKELRDLRQEEVGGLKSRFENAHEANQKRINRLESQLEEQGIASRQSAKNRLDEVKLRNDRDMIRREEANQELVSDLKKEMQTEQSKFIENTKRQVNLDREDLKENLNTQFARKEHSLNKQIEDRDKNLKRTVDAYESRLANMRKKSANEIEQTKILENERRLADQRDMKKELAAKGKEFENTLRKVKDDFERKMSKTKINNDLHIAKLTERYENLLDTQRKELKAEMKRKTSLLQGNYDRLATKSEMEKDAMVTQFQIKMDKLREANRAANEVKNTRSPRTEEA